MNIEISHCIFNKFRRLTSKTLSYLHLGMKFVLLSLRSYLGFRIDVESRLA